MHGFTAKKRRQLLPAHTDQIELLHSKTVKGVSELLQASSTSATESSISGEAVDQRYITNYISRKKVGGGGGGGGLVIFSISDVSGSKSYFS